MIPGGGFYPRQNIVCLALRAVVEDGGLGPEDREWAVRCDVETDGMVRLHPIFPSDLPRFVEDIWEDEPSARFGWSLRPDR